MIVFHRTTEAAERAISPTASERTAGTGSVAARKIRLIGRAHLSLGAKRVARRRGESSGVVGRPLLVGRRSPLMQQPPPRSGGLCAHVTPR